MVAGADSPGINVMHILELVCGIGDSRYEMLFAPGLVHEDMSDP
jgi:hypothetical protein